MKMYHNNNVTTTIDCPKIDAVDRVWGVGSPFKSHSTSYQPTEFFEDSSYLLDTPKFNSSYSENFKDSVKQVPQAEFNDSYLNNSLNVSDLQLRFLQVAYRLNAHIAHIALQKKVACQ